MHIFLNIANCIIIFILTYTYTSLNKAFLALLIASIAYIILPSALINSIAILIVFLAAMALFRYYDNMKISRIIPLGILVSILGLIRLDMATFIYGMYFWAMFWAGMANVDKLSLPLFKRVLRGLRRGVFFTLVVILAAVPYLIFQLINNNLDLFIKNLCNEILKMFSSNGIFKIPENIVFFLPLIIYFSSLSMLIFKHRRKILLASAPNFWKEMLILNFGLNLYPQAVASPDAEHFLPLLLVVGMLLPNLIFSYPKLKSKQLEPT